MKNFKQKGFTPLENFMKQNSCKKQRNQKFLTGFTFLEAMIAIAVLTIGIVAILQVFPLAFSIERTSQMKTKAALLVQEKIEEINSKSYQDIIIGEENEGVLPYPFEKFSRETIIRYVDSGLQESAVYTDLKKIEIIVSWESFLKLGEII